MALRFKIDVEAPPEQVFATVADLANHGRWANPKAGLEVRPVSEGPVKVGSTFRSSQRFAGKDTGADITITQYRPSSTLAFDAVQAGKKKSVRYTNTFTLTPSGRGTTVERAIDISPASPIAVIAYPAIRADAMKTLRQLKAQLERR